MPKGSLTSGLNGWLWPISGYRAMWVCSSCALVPKAYEVRFRSRCIAMTSNGRISISIASRRLYSAIQGFVENVTVS